MRVIFGLTARPALRFIRRHTQSIIGIPGWVVEVTEVTSVATLKRAILRVVKRRKFHVFRSDVNVNTEWIYIYLSDWTALFVAQKSRARLILMEPA